MLECVVFCSGALVMVLEMAGSRVLAPHLGTSLIVWTSLIGVVLAFLALGAFWGGRLADSRLSRRVLSVILAVAGLSSLVTALMHRDVGHVVASSISNPYAATVAASTALLAVPALFFGMVSPYVIRLRLERLDTSGRTVGRLYALSTAGSIVGTFLGGFVLLAWFTTTQILFGVAGGMILLALLVFPKGSLAMAGLLAWCGAAWYSHGQDDLWAGAWPGLEIVETPYNTLTIAEGFMEGNPRRMRFLSTDPGSCQSAVFVDDPDALALSYTHFYGLGTALKPEASSVLMLGGGGYSVPRWLLAGRSGLSGDFTLDVVELDPGMTRVTREHFGLPDDPRLSVIHQDARIFLNHNAKAYDLVFVDVFGSWYSVPFHMGTVEAMEAMRRAVAPGGLMVMNIISALEGEQGKLFESITASIRQHFAEVHVFAVRAPGHREEVQNIMVLAFPEARPDLAATLAQRPPDAPGEAQSFRHMLARQVDVGEPKVPALTDAYAPVERYVRSML